MLCSLAILFHGLPRLQRSFAATDVAFTAWFDLTVAGKVTLEAPTQLWYSRHNINLGDGDTTVSLQRELVPRKSVKEKESNAHPFFVSLSRLQRLTKACSMEKIPFRFWYDFHPFVTSNDCNSSQRTSTMPIFMAAFFSLHFAHCFDLPAFTLYDDYEQSLSLGKRHNHSIGCIFDSSGSIRIILCCGRFDYSHQWSYRRSHYRRRTSGTHLCGSVRRSIIVCSSGS